ncbi:hypothetical protein IWX90DRAFT_421976 [Phyllosticta citrichinensis]|uniref:UBC core domain-containing protein n=1 Tax=Phyllosticta citrichinensis TaxID=1130410 RepID=A0ABR1Y839_9PEZI
MPGPTIFVEDTVSLKGTPWLIGVVDRTNHDVDTHEPDPQRDYPVQIRKHAEIPQPKFRAFMKNGIPPRGTALVAWQTDSSTELIAEAHLSIVDRSIFVGDIVKRDANSPMSGTVIGTKLTVTIAPIRMWPEVDSIRSHGSYEKLVGDDTHGIPRSLIPAEELETLRQFPVGALIIHNDWIGRLDDAFDEVTLRLSNGTVVIVENPDELEPIDPRLARHEVGDYVGTKKGNLRRGRWIFGAFNPNVEPGGVVIAVRTVSINVQWLTRRMGGPTVPGQLASEPPFELGLDELESGRVKVYDNMKKPPADAPAISSSLSVTAPDLTAGQRVRFKDLAGACVKYAPHIKKRPRTETLGYDTNVFTVQTTQTSAIVQWQDLSVSEDKSVNLLPDPVDDDDQVWPGEVVITNDKKERDPENQVSEDWYSEPARIGVVQTVDGTERMATVKWFQNASVKFVGNDLLPDSRTGVASGTDEKVSLYDISSPSALSRRRGDFVIIHDTPSQGASMDNVDWFGEVVDLCLDGQVIVRLSAANPVRDVKVSPDRCMLAYGSDVDEALAAAHDQMIDSDEDDYGEGDDESMDEDQDFFEMWYEYPDQNGRRVLAEEENEDDEWATDDEDDLSSADVTMGGHGEGDIDTSKTTPEAQHLMELDKEASGNVQVKPDTNSAAHVPELFSFSSYPNAPPAFDILESDPPQDHKYLASQSELGQQRMRRIQKEHKILRSSLPPGILVRTWESRLDLLRVLIIGPIDTPYEYAPFLIDLHLGTNFPTQPPEAYFHSWTNGTGPVNPNLYEDGKICLSLLGTWHADERNENWSPAKSTILQILVSLMGLVLVKEPYYNEAGYEVRQGTEETALSSAFYSEKAYFRARGFIMHGLKFVPEAFKHEMEWLYHQEDGPKLLEKAIDAAKDIVAQSESGNDGGKRDGLRRISGGAVIALKRQLDGMEKLRVKAGQ